MKYITMVLSILAVFAFATPALALDPACDKADPNNVFVDFSQGKPYIVKNGELAFCAPYLEEDGTTLLPVDSMTRCELAVNGSPYAIASIEPGDLLLITIAPGDKGPSTLACVFSLADSQGTLYEVDSLTLNFTAEDLPVPEAPYPLVN